MATESEDDGELVGPFLLEDIDPTSYQIRETFAYFGRAAYMAQVLEHGLVNLIAMFHIAEAQAGKVERVPDPWQAEFKKTLGVLIKKFATITEGRESELHDQLMQCLKDRNFIAHGFWRERSDDFMTESGRTNMITELDAITERFAAADQEVDRVLFKISAAFGITPERVRAEYERMRDSLQPPQEPEAS